MCVCVCVGGGGGGSKTKNSLEVSHNMCLILISSSGIIETVLKHTPVQMFYCIEWSIIKYFGETIDPKERPQDSP